MLAGRKISPIVGVLCLTICVAGFAEQPPKEKEKQEDQFLRLVRDKNESPVGLEAAIVRYAPKDRGKGGPTVALVSAVHVADAGFYDRLNQLFATYDVVLYELVAPEGTRIPKGGRRTSENPISMIQVAMTNLLELEFQLEGVDYTKDNFVHADMTPEEVSASMRRRGESVFQIFFRMLGYAMAQQAEANGDDVRLLMALFSKDRAMALKRIMAEQMEDMEGSLTVFNGPDGSTIITERNKVALEVLRKQIAEGKKKVAIFYGAGHMPDFQKRLDKDFGLVPIHTQWLVAWDLDGSPKSTKPAASKRKSKAAKPSVVD